MVNQIYNLYVLKCSDGTLYTGITNNLNKRLIMHRLGKGSKYVRSRLPFQLVYLEKCQNKSQALKRELEVKQLSRAKKQKLFSNN